MEKIYYDELLNHKVIERECKIQDIKTRRVALIVFLMGVSSMSVLSPISSRLFTQLTIVTFMYVPIGWYLMHKRGKETNKIENLVNFYNDSIKISEYIEVDNDLKLGFIVMCNNIILNKLQLICEPEFMYDDETKVYTAQNTQIIIVNGYFKDTSVSRTPKRKYIMVFVDCEYYMCCIDNLICWEKGTYWSKFYKEKALKNAKIDYTKW